MHIRNTYVFRISKTAFSCNTILSASKMRICEAEDTKSKRAILAYGDVLFVFSNKADTHFRSTEYDFHIS
jgi:hypothetical protein